MRNGWGCRCYLWVPDSCFGADAGYDDDWRALAAREGPSICHRLALLDSCCGLSFALASRLYLQSAREHARQH